jgi:hypothetical protein
MRTRNDEGGDDEDVSRGELAVKPGCSSHRYRAHTPTHTDLVCFGANALYRHRVGKCRCVYEFRFKRRGGNDGNIITRRLGGKKWCVDGLIKVEKSGH